jgi:PIN domain nuclease of toxin-antitoxin system
MIVAVADTHAALWHLFGNLRLSSAARAFIGEAAKLRQKVAVSSVSLAEVVYLIEKGRIPAEALNELIRALNDTEGVFEEVPLTQQIVMAMRQVSREEVRDLPDRVVAATGLHLRVPVISRDGSIRASSIHTIW